MKKKIGILLAVMILVTSLVSLFAIIAIAEDLTEGDTITISYMESRDTTSTTTTLDKTAYENGKQVVKVGEKFTLPTTSSTTYAGKDGFQLVWYTEDGRTYKAGEEVSFDKDTKLFRTAAKECYTISDVNYAMTNESCSAILMADITTSEGISVRDQDMSALILNGYTMNFTRNGDIIGNQRSGKQILGEGTLNVQSTDGKVGSYYVYNCQGHGYNGTKNRSVVGRDVTINAPDFWLAEDWDGTNAHHPWIRIYGKIDVYGIMVTSTGPTRTQLVEIYENAVVKINGPSLYKTYNKSSNTLYYFNNHAIQTRIYGGTFYLPAEAENLSFWTDDYTEEYVVNGVTYTPRELTDANKDTIQVMGGTFILPDNKVPAIESFLTEDYVQAMHSGGNGLVTNNNESTYYVPYYNIAGYKLVFSKYTSPTPAKLVVTAFDGTKTEYRYETTKTADGKAIETINIYEASIKEVDGVETTVYETLTDDFTFIPSANGLFAFKNEKTSQDYQLVNFDVNGVIYQTVVTAGCEHDFEDTIVEASCQNAPYAEFVCSVCDHSVYFNLGEKLDHNYVLGEHVEATLTSLGSKTYTCSLCGDSRVAPYSLDPSSLEVAVKIRLDDGTFEEITVLASDVFEFATAGSDGDYIYTLSAIKAFGDYKVRNIYGITIPKGILFVNITTQNVEKYSNVEYGVAELTVADGAYVNFVNIGNLRKLEKITVGKNTDIVFNPSCSYYNPNNERRDMPKLTTIDLSAGSHSVVFMNSAFNGRSNIANLILGENSHYGFMSSAFYNCAITELKLPASNTYAEFGASSFYGNDMTELILPNGLDLSFGANAFENCVTLTNVQFSENATYSIGNYAFRYCLIPKVTFAKNSTYTVGAQAFYNTALTEVDASAGNITLTLNESAFNCDKSSASYCDLSTFKFGENSTYVISKNSFNYATFTELVLAPNSQYTFKAYFICGNTNKTDFTTIDASASGITVTFESEALRGNKAFNNLKINGEGSTYTFVGSSFYDTAITEVTLGQDSTYTFNNCFNGSTPIAKIDASADNLNVTVNNYGWGKNTITTILINGKNGTYNFNNEAFRNSIFTELTLGEGSTYNFNGGSMNTSNSIKKLDASASNITLTVANSVFHSKTNLETLDISGANSTYTFGQETFRNTKVKELKAGENSTYSFGNMCFYAGTALETVDFSANNVTATFGNQICNGVKTIKFIAFGENSTYKIGEYAFSNSIASNDIVFAGTSSFEIGREAFRYADFASITFEDNCDVTFKGIEAFKDCDQAKSLYIGKNIAITNYPFKNLKALETLYIMEGVTHASEWEFDNAGSADFATPFVVYNHSYDFAFSKSTFNNCDGIVLYTVTDNIGTRTDVFSNCGDTNGYKAWTVYLGIPHPVVEGFISAPNCTEEGVTGWVSDATICDCDFKITEDKVVNMYEKVHNITEATTPASSSTFAVTIAAPLGHDYGVEAPVRLDWVYVDKNYFENAKNKHNCTVCGVDYLGKDIENSALFVKKGTSVSEFSNDALGHVIFVNLDAVDAYNAYLGEGNEIKFGVVAGVASENGKPINNDGTANGKTFAFAFENTDFSILQIKITGITNEAQALYCCSYVIVGGEVSYLHNETVKSTATAVSLANPNGIEEAVENVSVEAVIDTKEKIYA